MAAALGESVGVPPAPLPPSPPLGRGTAPSASSSKGKGGPPPAAPPPPGPGASIGWIPRTKEKKRQALLSSATMANSDTAEVEKKIPWHLASAFRRSTEGSTGVFFVELPEGIVVVKGCEGVVTELFAAELALMVGINVPKMRVIEYSKSEWSTAKSAIISLAAKNGEVDKIKAERELQRAFFLVMEYIRGTDLERLGPKAKTIFKGPGREKQLRDLGEVICLDIVLNNWDRLPVVWDNDGNFRNVYLAGGGEDDDGWQVVGIDQSITPIQNDLHPEGFEKYMERVRTLMQHIFDEPNKEAPELERLRECVAKALFIELPPESGLLIQQGIASAAKRFSELSMDDLASLREDIANMITRDWEQVWERGVAQIHLPFLESVLSIFKEVIAGSAK